MNKNRKAPQIEALHRVRVWDLPTRVFHWALVACVVGLTITGEMGGDMLEWHARLGYAAASLLVFRVLWGVVGGRWSRFASFIYPPRSVSAYLRGEVEPAMAAGHSPLGALSVFALLLLLLAQVGTGLFAEDRGGEFVGPLSAQVSDAAVRLMTLYHKNVGKPALIVLVSLHVLAIAYYVLRKRQNLVGAMLSGDKKVPAALPPSRDDARSRLFALALLGLCAGAVTLLVNLGGS